LVAVPLPDITHHAAAVTTAVRHQDCHRQGMNRPRPQGYVPFNGLQGQFSCHLHSINRLVLFCNLQNDVTMAGW
jgi:hypothetical protein